jgi:hypothetical protein
MAENKGAEVGKEGKRDFKRRQADERKGVVGE